MQNSPQPRSTAFRHLLPAGLLFLTVYAAALPSGDALSDPQAHAAPVLLGLLFSVLFGWALRGRHAVVSCLLLAFASVYAYAAGDTALAGSELQGLRASEESVRMALWMLGLFLATVALGTAGWSAVWERLLGRLVGRIEQRVGARPAAVGLGAMLLVALAVSIQAGAWSYYGAAANENRDGTIRLEFFYDPALLSALLLTVHALLETAHTGLLKRRPLLALVLVALTGLLFLRQMRRLMLCAALMSALSVLEHPTIGARYLTSARRMLVGLLLIVALAVGVNTASLAFRESARDFQTNDVGRRLSDVSTRITNPEEERDMAENTRQRLTYLALDAAAVEYRPVLQHTMTLEEMFFTTVVLFTPKMIYPQKYRYPIQVCESAFVDLRVYEDLPCTAQAEGFLAAGPWGVFLVALSWTPFLGLASFLFRRRSALGIIAAMHLIGPFLMIEGSAFPFVQALRITVLGVSATVACALVWRVFERRSPAASVAASRPLAPR